MRHGFDASNKLDRNGNPSGGYVRGVGFEIRWQAGPLGRGDHRIAPNGTFVEDVIDAARQRLAFYQEGADGRFACPENATAIYHLQQALAALDSRTARREAQGTEGTYQEDV